MQEMQKARKDQRKDADKELGEILGDYFMQTKVEKCVQGQSGQHYH